MWLVRMIDTATDPKPNKVVTTWVFQWEKEAREFCKKIGKPMRLNEWDINRFYFFVEEFRLRDIYSAEREKDDTD